MQWNYVIYMLLFAGIVSTYDYRYEYNYEHDYHSEYQYYSGIVRRSVEENITLSCCGFRKPPLKRSEQLTDNRIHRRNGRDIFSPHQHKRDIKNVNCAEPRIVGGEEAEPHSWPWMVVLLRHDPRVLRKRHLCGASLISQKYVLTAGHCIYFFGEHIDTSKFFVRVGSHHKYKDGPVYGIEHIVVHKEYHYGVNNHDIALIRVKGRVKLSDKVYPICLPSNAQNEEGPPGSNNMTIIGWGDTKFKGKDSDTLQEVTLPFVPLKECEKPYKETGEPEFKKVFTHDVICAGGNKKGSECQGDSGGPLMKKVNGRWFQYGVSSFAFECRTDIPSVFTRITRYTNWIYSNTDLGQT